MKFRGKQVLLVLLAGMLSLPLVGCASKPQVRYVVLQKQTLQQLRQNYIDTLQSEQAKVIQLGETVSILIHSDEIFNPGSANFADENLPVLNTAAKLIRTYRTVTVKVTAYSDNRTLPGAPKNREQALTIQQAKQVADYLKSYGVNTRLIYAEGYGAQHRIAGNDTALGRYLNRRVEISFRFYPRFKPYN